MRIPILVDSLLWIWIVRTWNSIDWFYDVEGFAGVRGSTSYWNDLSSGASISSTTKKDGRGDSKVCMASESSSWSLPNEEELRNQKSEALTSLCDYHEGTWECKEGATSFSISSDVAAGIIRKSRSMPYRTSVSLRASSSNLKMVETFAWKQPGEKEEEEEMDASWMASTREVPISGPSIDVDSVDASFSVDQALMDLPTAISGSNAIIQFGVEHVLAISDNQRVRSFCLYGMDDRLARVVITNELRQQLKQSTTVEPPLQLFQDEDEELSNSIQRLFSSSTDQRKILQQQAQQLKDDHSNANKNDNRDSINQLKEYPISTFGLSLGPWLGDAVIRDRSPFWDNKKNKNIPNKGGFGNKKTIKSKKSNNPNTSSTNDSLEGFAEWSIGVQKVAMQYKWDFGETLRHTWESGRSMGVSLCPSLPKSSMGTINEKLMSKRIHPKEQDRMLYIDYDMGAYAGFTLGSVYLKVPTFLFFSKMNAQKLVHPFITQFAVFQKNANTPDPASHPFPSSTNNNNEASSSTSSEIICSKMMRLYNNNGQLKQGITSFFTLHPLSTEADMMDP